MGLHAAEQRAASVVHRRIIERRADQRLRRVRDQHDGGRHRAERHARIGARSRLSSSVSDTRAADDGDIHFGARDEAQIGVRRPLRPGGQEDGRDEFARCQHGLAGAGRDVGHGHVARAVRPAIRATASAAIIAGTLSAAGEPLQRLPAMVARPWIWVEPIRSGSLDDAGPGGDQVGMLRHFGAGNGRADAQAAVLRR